MATLRTPVVIGGASDINPGGQQQMQAGDLIDPSLIPGRSNGDLALSMVAQLIMDLQSSSAVLITPSLVETASAIQQLLPIASDAVMPVDQH
jgi:hypothetical protein